ncbi:hypothetical protein [Dokdonella sp.]|uniref:hypothetical protein n=1 Tax=Dokdonella sp. TaxID=2291710 RepID=UPI003784BABC
MFGRLFFLLRLVGVGIAIVASFDAVVFRSGWYARWLEPESVAGATRSTVRRIEATTLPGRRNILVIGNSKVGEGLSTVLADSAVSTHGLHFVAGAIPGSDVRIWYYLLREIDPDARRFRAIVLAPPLAVDEDLAKMADHAADIAYLTTLLRLGDIASFPSSFEDPILRDRASRAILFPAQPLRRDVATFLWAPALRYAKVKDSEANGVANYLRYPGRSQAFPDLPIDPATRAPSRWDGIDDPTRQGLLDHYFRWLHARPAPDVVASNDRYYRHWLGLLVERYRGTGVPLILFEAPRGPWHGSEVPAAEPNGAIADLIASGDVLALPGSTFVDIERPHNFFDFQHMNRAGRELFTARLAQRIEALLR